MNTSRNLPRGTGIITRREAFGLLRILFGLTWVLNTWFQADGAYINRLFLQSFNAGINGQPEWLAQYTKGVIYVIEALGAPWRRS